MSVQQAQIFKLSLILFILNSVRNWNHNHIWCCVVTLKAKKATNTIDAANKSVWFKLCLNLIVSFSVIICPLMMRLQQMSQSETPQSHCPSSKQDYSQVLSEQSPTVLTFSLNLLFGFFLQSPKEDLQT